MPHHIRSTRLHCTAQPSTPTSLGSSSLAGPYPTLHAFPFPLPRLSDGPSPAQHRYRPAANPAPSRTDAPAHPHTRQPMSTTHTHPAPPPARRAMRNPAPRPTCLSEPHLSKPLPTYLTHPSPSTAQARTSPHLPTCHLRASPSQRSPSRLDLPTRRRPAPPRCKPTTQPIPMPIHPRPYLSDKPALPQARPPIPCQPDSPARALNHPNRSTDRPIQPVPARPLPAPTSQPNPCHSPAFSGPVPSRPS